MRSGDIYIDDFGRPFVIFKYDDIGDRMGARRWGWFPLTSEYSPLGTGGSKEADFKKAMQSSNFIGNIEDIGDAIQNKLNETNVR